MTEQQELNNQIRGEEDTTNIRRIGAKDRKKRIQMTGALFPDEPMDEAGDAAPPTPPVQPAPSEQPQTVGEVAEVEPRPASASKRPVTAATRAAVTDTAVKPRTASTRTASTRPAAKPKRRSSNALLYNLIALIFVLATVAALVYFVFLWDNYNSPLNPFAPPTPMPNFIIVTPSS